MRRADAIKAAETRRHANRAARIGTERGVADPGGDGRGRAGRRAAGHPVRGPRIDRRAVERILADDAERDLVGDGLADQCRAAVE